MESNEYLNFAKEMCSEAGKIMKKYFYQDSGISYKGDRTIVTLADKEINHILIEKVKEKFPNHSVDGEEEKFGESKYVWVCDPVDGTAMYARHIPVAVFSLALVIDGVPEVGVVYDPFLDNLYSAVKVIVEEAGGKVTDLFGNEQRYDEPINGALISNGVVHDELIKSAKANIKQRL